MQKVLFIWRELLALFEEFMGFCRTRERTGPQIMGYHPNDLQSLAVQYEV